MNTEYIDYTYIAEKWFENQFENEYSDILSFELTKEEIIHTWLSPLLKILFLYLKGRENRLMQIYLGERLNRPFSFNATLQEKRLYLSKTMPKDIQLIKTCLPTLNDDIIIELERLHIDLISGSQENKVNLTFLGDCLINHTNNLLSLIALKNDIYIKTHENHIGAWVKDSDFNLKNKEFLFNTDTINIIAISFFTYWGIPTFRNLMKLLWDNKISDGDASNLIESITQYISNYIDDLLERENSIIFIHNASGLPWLSGFKLDFFPWNVLGIGNYPALEKHIGKINNEIDKIIECKKNVYLIDERSIMAQYDSTTCAQAILAPEAYNSNERWPMFHYSNMEFYLADEYWKIINRIIKIKSRKVIFVDFDNTLWSGLMTEGSVQHFVERQKIISSLGTHGVILIALSKNEEKNIRWSQLRINREEFSLIKINWNSKISNIIKSIKELNISPDNCILLDDSEEELAIINQHIPQIMCLNSKQSESWITLEYLLKTNLNPTQSSKNRNKLYQQNLKRNEYIENEKKLSDPHYLFEALNINITTRKAIIDDINRIVELLSRTNQFNLSGKKYSEKELSNLLFNLNWKIILFDLEDKFGDMGIIGLIIAETLEPEDTCIIHNFVMSCRAMGYGAEQFMLAKFLQFFSSTKIVCLLNQTAKNTAAQEFITNSGFRREMTTNIWHLEKNEYPVDFPSWIKDCSML